MSDNSTEIIETWFKAHIGVAERTLSEQAGAIAAAGERIIERLREGATIFICGNGGSAADAQHFAAEIVGNFKRRERAAMPALALTVDSSALTSISNDFGYEQVFSRQLEGLARAGDLVVGITTSGTSKNVVAAFDRAQALGVECIALVGESSAGVAPLCSHIVSIPTSETAKVQEMHIAVIHSWCEMIDLAFTS